MTAQEIFDTVVAHLRKQKYRSMNAKGMCMYRGSDGLKCAVGVLIPDELYHPGMEYSEAGYENAILELMSHRELSFLKGHETLLMNLQDIHDAFLSSIEDIKRCQADGSTDQNWRVEKVEERLKSVAHVHKLEYQYQEWSYN